MRPIGLSVNGKMSDVANIGEALFADFREAGISCMEVSLRAEQYPVLNDRRLRELADRFGITLWSFHLPFQPFETLDISARDASIRRASVAYQKSLIARAGAIGIETFVLHASGEPIAEEEREERMKCAQESLSMLAEAAERAGGRIAVEDLPRTCLGRDSSDILRLIGADERLRVCFDTNHLLTEDPVDFVRRVGAKIVTVHVSDYDCVNERHWLPGEGIIDWQALYRTLSAVGYSGPWLYELSYEAPKTIMRPRDLTPEDFVRNAREIFDGKTPTPIGTPKPGIGMW